MHNQPDFVSLVAQARAAGFSVSIREGVSLEEETSVLLIMDGGSVRLHPLAAEFILDAMIRVGNDPGEDFGRTDEAHPADSSNLSLAA